MFKEIKVDEINNYKDSISLFKDGAIAFAKDNSSRTNALTIGWGGIGVLWRKPCATIYINKQRYSKEVFDNSDHFSINFFSKEYNNSLSYFGTHSGRNEDKIANGGLDIDLIDDIPYFKDARLVIICSKMGQSDFDINNIRADNIVSWYKEDGVHTLYYGEITKVLLKND